MSEKEESKKPEPIYTDPEVGQIMYTLQNIYALDDAISNQMQLRRPEAFIRPLSEIRDVQAAELKRLTAKSGSAENPDKK